MKTSKFYLGSQAQLMPHQQYFPMHSNQLHMCPEQKCKCASIQISVFQIFACTCSFSWLFQSLLKSSTWIIYKEEKSLSIVFCADVSMLFKYLYIGVCCNLKIRKITRLWSTVLTDLATSCFNISLKHNKLVIPQTYMWINSGLN